MKFSILLIFPQTYLGKSHFTVCIELKLLETFFLNFIKLIIQVNKESWKEDTCYDGTTTEMNVTND